MLFLYCDINTDFDDPPSDPAGTLEGAESKSRKEKKPLAKRY